MTRTTLRLIATQFAVCSITLASEGPPPILNPATYTSPSGEYTLSVNPTDLYGRGPADCRFTKRGEVVWTNRLPFTLWQAGVANSGHIGGYAYSHGWRGFSEAGFEAGMGNFIVAVLSPTGRILGENVSPREDSHFLHTPPNPLCRGLVIDDHANRLVVRIADSDLNRGIEQWWVYALNSGKRVATLEPETQMADSKHSLSIIAASAVPSTPLILIHWWKVDYPRPPSGLFTLVDKTGKPVWVLTLDRDYSVPTDEAREDEIWRLIWKDGGILGVGTNATFDLHFVKDGLRTSYAVKQDAHDKWKVKKIGQAPYPWPHSIQKPSSLPALSLRKLKETTLSVPSVDKERQIRALVAFDFDPEGNICALRAGRNTHPCLLLLSQNGVVLKELRLPIAEIPKQVQFSNPAYVGDRRFVVSVSAQGIGGSAQFFLADFSAGTVKRIANASCPTADAIAGFPDGRFVALTTRHMKYTLVDGLFLFDPNGKLIWSKEQQYGYSGKPDDLLSPEDIARCGTNAIAVLDNVRHTIQIFDAGGILARIIDLEKVWGRKPNYPTDIASDLDAGFLVYDFNAQQPLLMLDANGSILAESLPRFADGRPFRVTDGVKRSPQGALWTSDGDSLFRLSTNSTVDLILGEVPTPSILSTPDHVDVGMDDRVYLSDRRTKSVHVFDALGTRLGQCDPTAEDLTELSGINHIAVSKDGNVYLSVDWCATRYLRFNKALNRTGWSSNDVDSIVQKWYFQPTNDLCWIVGYHDLFLVRGLSNVVRRIGRRADGRWLEYPQLAAVASDGSLAVVARSQSGDISVSTYGPTGNDRSTFRIPGEGYVASIAYDGQHVYIRTETDLLMFGPNGESSGSFVLGSGRQSENWTGPFLAAKQSELWFISRSDMIIHRYAVPAESQSGAPRTGPSDEGFK